MDTIIDTSNLNQFNHPPVLLKIKKLKKNNNGFLKFAIINVQTLTDNK